MAGRPSSYTQKIADEICGQLAEGRSLRTICKADDMPSCVTVYAWMRAHPEFLKQYTRAKEDSADALAEEMLDIADDGTNDWYEQQISEGVVLKKPDTEHINRSRLRVDTRKWIASKLKPKKYGEKLDIAHSGSIETVSREALIERLTGLYATASSRLDGSGAAGTAGSDAGVPTTH